MAVGALPSRLLLAGACGLLLVGGIAGATIVEEDDGMATPTAAGAPLDEVTTRTTVAGAAAPGEVTTPTTPPMAAGGAVPTVTTGGTPGTGLTGGGAATTPTPKDRTGGSTAPGPLVAPKPGTHVYQSTSTSSSGTRTDRAATTVEAAGAEGSATIQNVTIPLELGGMQATARNTVAWSSAGAVVRRSLITVTSLGGQQLDCVWQPPFAQYAGGLAVGRRWSFSTSCAGQIGSFDVMIEQRASRKVTGSTSVAGPAGPLATWTITDDTTVVITSPLGAGSVRTTGTQQLAPSLGLPVSTDMRAEARQAGQPPQQTTVKTKLVALP